MSSPVSLPLCSPWFKPGERHWASPARGAEEHGVLSLPAKSLQCNGEIGHSHLTYERQLCNVTCARNSSFSLTLKEMWVIGGVQGLESSGGFKGWVGFE